MRSRALSRNNVNNTDLSRGWAGRDSGVAQRTEMMLPNRSVFFAYNSTFRQPWRLHKKLNGKWKTFYPSNFIMNELRLACVEFKLKKMKPPSDESFNWFTKLGCKSYYVCYFECENHLRHKDTKSQFCKISSISRQHITRLKWFIQII